MDYNEKDLKGAQKGLDDLVASGQAGDPPPLGDFGALQEDSAPKDESFIPRVEYQDKTQPLMGEQREQENARTLERIEEHLERILEIMEGG